MQCTVLIISLPRRFPRVFLKTATCTSKVLVGQQILRSQTSSNNWVRVIILPGFLTMYTNSSNNLLRNTTVVLPMKTFLDEKFNLILPEYRDIISSAISNLVKYNSNSETKTEYGNQIKNIKTGNSYSKAIKSLQKCCRTPFNMLTCNQQLL